MEVLEKVSKLLHTPGLSDQHIQKLLEMVDAFGDYDASQAIRYEVNERFHGRGAPIHNANGSVKNRV